MYKAIEATIRERAMAKHIAAAANIAGLSAVPHIQERGGGITLIDLPQEVCLRPASRLQVTKLHNLVASEVRGPTNGAGLDAALLRTARQVEFRAGEGLARRLGKVNTGLIRNLRAIPLHSANVAV